MNLNFQHIKDSFAILAFIVLLVLLAYFNGCNREYTTPNSDYEKELLESSVEDANNIVDSLLCEIVKLKNDKQPIETRIVKRNIYITEKSDTVRKLIKDSVFLAYVDTLEAQIFDYDSLVKIQVAEILKLDKVIIQKDTIIHKMDLIQAITEKELEAQQSQNKKQARKIKGLKITAIAAPIGVLLLTLLAK